MDVEEIEKDASDLKEKIYGRDNDSGGLNNLEHKISFRDKIREGYFGFFIFLIFVFIFQLWDWLLSSFFLVDNFKEILIYVSSFIVPTYFSILISFYIFGEHKESIPEKEPVNIVDIYSHQPEKATFVVFILTPILLTFWENAGIILIVSYYVFVVNKMRKQTQAERSTLIMRIIAIISVWLSTVLFIFN